jgi:hypothetical protein
MKKLLIMLFATFIFANVSVKVNKTEISQGEEVIFTIIADGKNVKLPTITKIGPYKVTGSADSENITIINGQMQSTVSRSYIFYPMKDVTIPSFKVIIDGKTFYTKPIKIKVDKLKKTNNKYYDLEISIDKNETFLGEGRILTIKFSQSLNANPQSIQIQKPNFENFLVKQITTNTYIKNNKKITEYKFFIIPQKSGNFSIGPIIANIGILKQENPFDDPFFSAAFVHYIKIVSNSINLKVKPILKNSIYGNFTIKLKANKTKTKANTPVKVTLKIKGCGDFYDMKDFKLNLKNATVYEEKPILNTVIKGDKLCGIYKKEFTIISPTDINISSISLTEFNGTLHKIKSNPLNIKVENEMLSTPVIENLTTEKNETKSTPKKIYKTNYIYIAAAFIIGLIIGLITKNFFKKNKKSEDIIERIKKANEKELFQILLPYSNNKEIEEILKKLEENIYKKGKNKISKKEIIKILKSL